MYSPLPRRLLLALALMAGCATARAGAVTQQQLVARASEVYDGRLAVLRAGNALDTDARFNARVEHIASGLIRQARHDYPETAAWSWEVHASTDPDQNADCMAGGKILVSRDYVERMELSDAELAMLLAHEIEHAALRHNLQEYRQALALDPGWSQRPFAELEDAVDHDSHLMAQLAPLNFAQEAEADREGLRLAWRAGWPAERLANYFKKLARASGWPATDSAAYPSPNSRWNAARALAASLGPAPASTQGNSGG